MISKFAVDQDKHMDSSISRLNPVNPMFHWVIKNIDFQTWSNSSDYQVLWLSGPLERRERSHHFIKLQDEAKSDISRFAHSFLKNLRLKDYHTKAVEYIIDNAHEVFLWVKLVGEELFYSVGTDASEEQIYNFLEKLPSGLEEFYQRMLDKLTADRARWPQGIKILQLVLFAARPLTVDEALHVLGIPDDHNIGFLSLDDYFQKRTPGKKYITQCGGNFLEIKEYNGNTHPKNLFKLVDL